MPRVLSVGQCGFDHSTISRQLGKGFGAEVVAAGSAAEALDALRGGRFDLVLINRVIDGDGSPGVELIRAVKADPALGEVPVMLVSNYPDAQRQAESLGARPGFGKAEIASPQTQERLRAVLAADADAPRKG